MSLTAPCWSNLEYRVIFEKKLLSAYRRPRARPSFAIFVTVAVKYFEKVYTTLQDGADSV